MITHSVRYTDNSIHYLDNFLKQLSNSIYSRVEQIIIQKNKEPLIEVSEMKEAIADVINDVHKQTHTAAIIDKFILKYHFLSNFYPCHVTYQGITYPSSEHAYQAMKSTDNVVRRQIASLVHSGAAKKMGKQIDLRSDWEDVKDQLMYDIVKAKFEQNEHLKEELLATNDATLIEGNTWHDTYWGICNGVGQNKLGKTLMKVREELKNEKIS